MLVGVVLGALAGYYGGLVDSVVSRLTELVMVFPFILFAIALAATVGPRLNSYTLFGAFSPGVLTLCLVMAMFSWFYPARIIRGQVLSLREQEFVEAARMLGASDVRIIRSHLLPHLVAPIVVWSSLHRGGERARRGGAELPLGRASRRPRRAGGACSPTPPASTSCSRG